MTLHGVMGARGHCDTTGPHGTKDSCNRVGHMEERDCFDTVGLHGAKESIVIMQEKRELLQMIQLLDFFNVTSVRGLFIFAQGEGN